MTPMNPPLGINAKVLGHSSVQVTWADGSLNANQIVTDNRYYLVHYRPQHQRRKKWRYVPPRAEAPEGNSIGDSGNFKLVLNLPCIQSNMNYSKTGIPRDVNLSDFL